MPARPRIAIRLGPATLAALDMPALVAEAGRIGTVTLDGGAGATILAVTGMAAESAAPRASIAASYQAAIAAAASGTRPGATVAPGEGTLFVATLDGVTLNVRVDRGGHIETAAHSGASTVAGAAVLDALCEELPGMTVQEAAEHGAIRLEFRLRATPSARPVRGIVLPRNADPVFALPERLLRALGANYRERTATRFGDNTFTRRIDAGWLARSDEDKRALLNALLAERIADLGLAPGDAEVASVEHQVRATIAFGENVPIDAKPRFLRAFERLAHDTVEPSIQVFMSEVKDANKLRRL